MSGTVDGSDLEILPSPPLGSVTFARTPTNCRQRISNDPQLANMEEKGKAYELPINVYFLLNFNNPKHIELREQR